jgi:hypothetical protein
MCRLLSLIVIRKQLIFNVPSELQVADLFTKSQTTAQHQFHLSKLNASDPPLPP